ncbi:MAG: histidine phosphatase family protein [Sphaerochaetaceae bacterium]|nr:histidine phosphatase family protein [Sphaerochaetaceae bacterium]
MKLHIIRHAESEANKEQVIAGQLDYPLTDTGKHDAAAIAREYLKHYRPERVYASHLSRALQTASPFAEHLGLTPIQDSRIAEHHVGVFQGISYEKAKALFTSDQHSRNVWKWRPEGGESYEEVARRLGDFFSSLLCNTGPCLIVTHGSAMRVMRGLLEHTLPSYPERVPVNGEVWELEFTEMGKPHQIHSLFFNGLSYRSHSI